MATSFKDKVFIASQYIIPHRGLSRLVGWVAETRIDWIKNLFISRFIRAFNVNMEEAERQTPEAFENFNDFFTRELKPGMRTVDPADNAIVSPADGAFSQLGPIENGRIFQAKGHDYSLTELLGGSAERAEPFMGGQFATIYLSPKDYHRLHMPVTGTLREMIYVPGDLFSVNQVTAENVPRLFARNERVVAIFDTELGPMALVLVGAMIVAGIETTWAGRITPFDRRVRSVAYPGAGEQKEPLVIEKGEEMGRFFLGSTIVVCFGEDKMRWLEDITATQPVRLGERIGLTLE